MTFRQALLGLVMSTAPLVHATGEAPLALVATIPMPDVRGRIDHLDVDVTAHRLFIAALGNNTVEVLDIGANRHSKSIPGEKIFFTLLRSFEAKLRSGRPRSPSDTKMSRTSLRSRL